MQIFSNQRLIPTDFSLTQAPRENFTRVQDMLGMEGPPAGILADNDPSQVFAEIVVNGQSVAKIYNSGAVESSNALGGRINALVKDDLGSGPTLAASRAERLASMLGGKVEKADTAMEQGAWQDWKLDRDQSLASYYNTTPTHIAAQDIASSEEDVLLDSPADEFREFMKKSAGERMVDQILKSMGLSAEDVAAMSPEERAGVMAKVQEIIEEKLRQASGVAGSGNSAIDAA